MVQRYSTGNDDNEIKLHVEHKDMQLCNEAFRVVELRARAQRRPRKQNNACNIRIGICANITVIFPRRAYNNVNANLIPSYFPHGILVRHIASPN